MNKNKPNPWLAQLDAKWEHECSVRLSRLSEIDLIALLIMCNDTLKVGPGRAGKVLNDFLATKMQIAEDICISAEDDPELLHPKKDIASRLKQIMGPENWVHYKKCFPLLKEYWDD